MTHHVLCVHGIGKHDNDWVRAADDGGQSFEDLFKEKWQKYADSLGDFDAEVKLHSIHYDDEIDKIFDSWAEQGNKLKQSLASSPLLLGEIDWFTGAIDRAAEAKNEQNWQYTHLLDLLLFVGSPTLQDRLVTYVGRQIIERINARTSDDSVSLIAHSMGTAMAHKTIQALYNEGVEMPDGGTQTLKGDFSFETVCMVANTSYALSRDRKSHYDGIVRPTRSVGDGCCSKWINVNHRLDPVGQFMPFNYKANPKWLDPRVEARGWHRDITPSAISSRAIHSINHYFRDPQLYMPFFELTFGARFSAKQRDSAIAEFEQGTPEGKFKALKAHLQALDVSQTESFKTFFQSLKSFFDLVRNAL